VLRPGHELLGRLTIAISAGARRSTGIRPELRRAVHSDRAPPLARDKGAAFWHYFGNHSDCFGGGSAMKILRLVAIAALVLSSSSALAQRWRPYANPEEGFQMMIPGEFELEIVDYTTEYGIVVPAHIYRHRNADGVYQMTVIDYRDSQRLHEARIKALDDVYLPVYGQVDVRGSMAYAARKIRERAATVEYDNYHYINRVDGHQLHTTNPDGTRTFAGIYLHRSRLYILEATINPGAPPGGMFQQSLEFIDENGEPMTYRNFEDVVKVLGVEKR
jgi:hypothetical protein